MTYLLHRDTCHAYLRGVRRVADRMIQYAQGNLHLSAITIMTLEYWIIQNPSPSRFIQGYTHLRRIVTILDVTDDIAGRAASLKTRLGRRQRLSMEDLLVAATALVRGLTLI